MSTPRPDQPRSRHRAPAPDRRAQPEPEEDRELDSYLAALTGSDEPQTELTGRFGSAQVFQLRLPPMRIEQLRRIAEERDVSPGALAVDWVIERLDKEDTPTGEFPAIREELLGLEKSERTEKESKWRRLPRLGRRS